MAHAALVFAACFLLFRTAFAFSLPATEFTLQNGLQVVVIEDHRAPVVTHSITYRVGSADEAPGKTGLAHLFEHLLFKGTPTFPYGTYARLIDESGGAKNAFTTNDSTTFYARVTVEQLAQVMELEADRMQNLALTDALFETERKVVQEERRQQTESDPTALFMEKLDATLYSSHPYGRPVVGWPEDVAALTRQDAEQFYRAHYMPANAILLVVGDVKPADVKNLAEKFYGPLRNPGPLPPHMQRQEPRHAAPLRLEVADARVSTPQILRKYLVPSQATAANGEAAALQIFANILGGTAQSRLYKQLVFGSRQATVASAFYAGDFRDSGLFAIYAAPAPGTSTQQLEAALDAELARMLKDGITDQELADAKNNLLADFTYQLDQPVGFGRLIALGYANGLSRAAIYGRDEAISAVTGEQVNAAGKRFLVPEQSATGLLLPQASGAVQ